MMVSSSMKVTILNIDGSDLASWFTDVVNTPMFKLPNHDPRCPYQIVVQSDKGEIRQPLETGIPLNAAIRNALRKVRSA